MIAGTLVITGLGTYKVGGFKYIWEKNDESGRIEFFKYSSSLGTSSHLWVINYFV